MENLKKNYDAVRSILPDGELYAVGGCVRDAYMGITPKDWDYTTNLTPDEMEPMIRSAGRRVYETGRRFGTLGFKVEVDGEYHLVEVTTYRTEYYDGKSRKPEVVYAKTIEEDLSRRDFTFNSMCYDGEKIIDIFGGKLDIYGKQVVTVGLPKDRIQEDPLRIFRAARFAARYGCRIDPNFIGKARQLADRIFDVSVERWVQELDKILTSPFADRGIHSLYDMGIMQRILPEVDRQSLLKSMGLPGQVYSPDDPDMMWWALLKHISVTDFVKNPTRTRRFISIGVCHRLKFSNSRTSFIVKEEDIK